MGNELTTTTTANQLPSVYDRMENPIAAVEKMGEWFYRSGLFGLTTPAAGAVVAMACLCERTNPIEVAKKYHVIEGRLSMKAEAILAEFNARGGKHVILKRDGDGVEVELTPANGKAVKFRFSWEEAKAESYCYQKDGKTLKTNWSTPRRRMQMLWARCVSDAVRAVDPGVVVGTYTPEEIADFEPAETPVDNSKAIAERREELQRIASGKPVETPTEPNIEPAVDVPFEATAEPVKTAEPEPEPESESTVEVADEPGPDPCTNGQLKELLSLAEECGIDKPTLREKACSFASVEEPQHMTGEQADQLIQRFKDAIEKKRSTSA